MQRHCLVCQMGCYSQPNFLTDACIHFRKQRKTHKPKGCVAALQTHLLCPRGPKLPTWTRWILWPMLPWLLLLLHMPGHKRRRGSIVPIRRWTILHTTPIRWPHRRPVHHARGRWTPMRVVTGRRGSTTEVRIARWRRTSRRWQHARRTTILRPTA